MSDEEYISTFAGEHDTMELSEEETGELAYNEDLQHLHDMYLELREVWENFTTEHYKGIVKRNSNVSRRRARVLSSEIAKKLKEYRAASNEFGKRS